MIIELFERDVQLICQNMAYLPTRFELEERKNCWKDAIKSDSLGFKTEMDFIITIFKCCGIEEYMFFLGYQRWFIALNDYAIAKITEWNINKNN
jgi:hypothetical protein